MSDEINMAALDVSRDPSPDRGRHDPFTPPPPFPWPGLQALVSTNVIAISETTLCERSTPINI